MNSKVSTAFKAALIVFLVLESVLFTNAIIDKAWLDAGLSASFFMLFAIALYNEYEEDKQEKLA